MLKGGKRPHELYSRYQAERVVFQVTAIKKGQADLKCLRADYWTEVEEEIEIGSIFWLAYCEESIGRED